MSRKLKRKHKTTHVEALSNAVFFWYYTEEDEIQRITSGKILSTEELKRKYQSLKLKITKGP